MKVENLFIEQNDIKIDEVLKCLYDAKEIGDSDLQMLVDIETSIHNNIMGVSDIERTVVTNFKSNIKSIIDDKVNSFSYNDIISMSKFKSTFSNRYIPEIFKSEIDGYIVSKIKSKMDNSNIKSDPKLSINMARQLIDSKIKNLGK